MENTKDLEFILRSLLISTPKIINANRLLKDYEENEGKRFPFRSLGFSSFVDYLKSIPSVVKLVPSNSHNPDVYPVATKESMHVEKLVSKQRITGPRSKRGGYNGYSGRFSRQSHPLPPRRRPPSSIPLLLPTPSPNKVPTTLDPDDFKETILWELVKKVASSKSGITVKELENHFRQIYGRDGLAKNGIHSGDDLVDIARDCIERIDDKIYPKMTRKSLEEPKSFVPLNHNLEPNHKSDPYTNCLPAGFVEDYDDEDYDNMDSNEFWDNVSEEGISNYTINLCSRPAVDPQIDDTNSTMKEDEEDKDLSQENHESDFSQVMIGNFRKILSKHPEGIWASQLQEEYFNEFHVSLDLLDLGYNSAIMMVSCLPNVFAYKRIKNHDWKLFDARMAKEVASINYEIDDYVPGDYEEDCSEGYVPKSIHENIKRLIEKYPEGFRSTSLFDLYQKEFKKILDLGMLGFKRFEDFLETLKNIVTIRKVRDYYLLLPKLSFLPLETTEPNASTEPLKVPAEAISALIPDNVLKCYDTLPQQELPDLNHDAKPNEPLLEMEVRVAEVISPGLFYFILDSNYNELQIMMEDLEKFYKFEEKNFLIPLPYVNENLICACKYDDTWHRAKVTGIRKNDLIDIEYFDYGTPGKVRRSDLRFLQSDFGKFPGQAICAKLIGIQPLNNEKKWPKETCIEFLKLVSEKRLLAHVYEVGLRKNKERVQLEVILYDTNGKREMILNECLVEKGLAEYDVKNEDIRDSAGEMKQNDNVFADQTYQLNEDIKKLLDDIAKSSTTSAGSQTYQSVQTDQFNQTPPKPRVVPPPPGFQKKDDFPQLQDFFSQQQFLKDMNTLPTNSYNMPYSAQYTNQHNLNTYAAQGMQQYTQNPQPNYLNNQPYYFYPPNNTVNHPLPALPHFPISRPPFPPNLHPVYYVYQNNALYVPQQNYHPQNVLNNANISNTNRVNIHHKYNNDGFVPIVPPPRSTFPLLPPANQYQNTSSKQMKQHLPVIATQTSVENIKDVNISRPDTPLTPPSAEVASLCNNINLINDSVEDTQGLLKFTDEPGNIKKAKEEDIPCELLTKCTLDNSISSPIKTTVPVVRNISSTSEEYLSATELADDTELISTNEEIKDLDQLINSSPCTSEKVPDSWEDIDLDDTPAKVQNFSEDFKKPLELIINDSYDSKIVSDTTEIKTEYNILPITKLQVPINWKDTFDPDVKIGCNNRVSENNCTNLETYNIKEDLIHKIGIENKFFHLIFVKNKLAVLCHEFFPQFFTLNVNSISKIMDSCNKPFTVLCKQQDPALFSKLDKLEFCGGVSKRDVLKLGRTKISYLSEIPELCSLLNNKNKVLLNKLKEILQEYNSI